MDAPPDQHLTGGCKEMAVHTIIQEHAEGRRRRWEREKAGGGGRGRRWEREKAGGGGRGRGKRWHKKDYII